MVEKAAVAVKDVATEVAKQGREVARKLDTSRPLDFSSDGTQDSRRAFDTSKPLDFSNDSGKYENSGKLDTSSPIDFSNDTITEASSQPDVQKKGGEAIQNKDVSQEAEQTEKKGGSYGDLKKAGHGWNHEPPEEVHHMPSDEASPLDRNDGPAIAMDYEDHRQTASCGNSREAQEYRAKQKELIAEGKFAEAMQMDIDDIRDKFGSKYDDAIAEMKEYAKSKGYI